MRRAGFIVTIVVATTVLAACNSSTKNTASSATTTVTSSAPTTAATKPALGTGPVKVIHTTFVDRSRKTVDIAGTRNSPVRTLPTDVYIPPGPGPFPLIVHSHGASGDPQKFSILLNAWAKQGYVVAAPQFPLSSDKSGGPVEIGDFENQSLDVRFVIQQLLATSSKQGSDLTGKIDPDHVGVSGLSLGGATTYGVAFNSCCREPHIDAAIIMSGIKLPIPDGTYNFVGTPVLIFHGTADPVIPYKTAPPAYQAAAAPKYFVSLIGAGHAPSYENTPDPHDALVIKVTSDFWDAYLRGNSSATQQLVNDAQVKNLASISYDKG